MQFFVVFVCIWLRSFPISPCLAMRRLRHNSIKAESSSGKEGREFRGREFPGHKCGYGRDDVFDNTEPQMTYRDPRASFSEFGYARGIAGNLLKLSRTLLNTRAVALALTGQQAEQLILAQYGVVLAKVPENCFLPLYYLLKHWDTRTWADITSRRAPLRTFLENELPTGCVPSKDGGKLIDPEDEKAAKEAAKALHVLNYGYWSTYEPLVSQEKSIIAFRSLDEMRWKQAKGSRLRQIWHYGRMHLLVHTDEQLRADMLEASHPDERRRLKYQIYYLTALQGMRLAQIEAIEFDGNQNCISAREHDVWQMLDKIRRDESAQFRTVVLWREKFWKSFAVHPLKSLTHPLLAAKKAFARTKEEWARVPHFGNRVGILLKPVVAIAGIAGLVLGVATAGEASLVTFIGMKLIQSGYTIALTTNLGTGVLQYMLSQAFHKPISFVSTHVTSEVLRQINSGVPMQTLYSLFDERSEDIEAARENLDMEIEKIMDLLDIEAIATGASEINDGDIIFDDIDVAEEVRRYVEGLVWKSFIDEMIPAIQEFATRKLARLRGYFGWLTYAQWKKTPQPKTSDALLGLYVKGPGIVGVSQVIQVGAKRTHGRGKRMLTLQKALFEGVGYMADSYAITMDKHLKSGMFVEDAAAYKQLYSSWLLWNDWTDYREGRSGRSLKGNMIYFDKSLSGCPEIWEQDFDYLKNLPTTPEIEYAKRALVTGHIFKFLGLGNRWLRVLRVESGSEPFYIELSDSVKGCLRVNDPDAYAKYFHDAPRRALEDAWLKGNVPRSSPSELAQAQPLPGKIVERFSLDALSFQKLSHVLRDASNFVPELVREMGGAGNDGESAEDRGSAMVETKYGISSVTLEAEVPSWLNRGALSCQEGDQRSEMQCEDHDVVEQAILGLESIVDPLPVDHQRYILSL